MSFTRILKIFLLSCFALVAGCAGVHVIPLHQGEFIELEFEGPVSLTYALRDGTEQAIEVEEKLELVLANRYDDGDPTQLASAERFFTYFRLQEDGGMLHLGMDPEAKHLIHGTPLFPDPAVIADYQATAAFELTNHGGGALKNSEPLRFLGNFTGAKAYRYQYSCVDPSGTTIFVYDVKVPKLCLNPNHVEISTEQYAYSYSREELATLGADGFHSILATIPRENLADRPSLHLKIINLSYRPDQAGPEGNSGTGLSGEENLPATDAVGGCGLAETDVSPHPGILLFSLAALTAIRWLGRAPLSKPASKQPSRRSLRCIREPR